MCGIAGIFDLSGTRQIDRGVLQRMNDVLHHRGPDGEGIYTEPGIGLAHRRLAIIDLASGDQPMFNVDRSVAIVFNGEIYNYLDLTKELEALGHIFRTRSDTEAIIHAWNEWGPDCVTRLRGMFAFAIHDHRRGSLFLARDRLGEKPLYYAIINQYCVFGSELKALLASGMIRKVIDSKSVDNYFAFGYVPDPQTIYQNVYKLPPAHTLLLQRGKTTNRPSEYWRLSFESVAVSESEAELELIDRLREAVRIRLMSEVPLGAFLSGGVDSSGVVAMMAQESIDPVKTFAIAIDGAEGDEAAFAAAVAHRYRSDHTCRESYFDPLNRYTTYARMFDEPFADISVAPTFQVSQLARSRVTVALSGDAGDELFAGYRRYLWHHYNQRIREFVPDYFRRTVFGTVSEIYPKLDWAPRWMRAKNTLQELSVDEVGAYFRSVCKVHDRIRYKLYTPATRSELGDHPSILIARHMEEADGSDALARAQYVDIKTYLPGDILTKVDRASMATSLEVRVPMLDHHFVEWAASLPSALKLHGREGKYILKRALEPFVPKENLYRRKRGFAASPDQIFRANNQSQLRACLTEEVVVDSGIFDLNTISRLINDHMLGRANHGQVLWSLLMFAGFLKGVHFSGNDATVSPASDKTLSITSRTRA